MKVKDLVEFYKAAEQDLDFKIQIIDKKGDLIKEYDLEDGLLITQDGKELLQLFIEEL